MRWLPWAFYVAFVLGLNVRGCAERAACTKANIVCLLTVSLGKPCASRVLAEADFELGRSSMRVIR